MEEKMKKLLTAEGADLRRLLDHHVRGRKMEGIVDTFEVLIGEIRIMQNTVKKMAKTVAKMEKKVASSKKG